MLYWFNHMSAHTHTPQCLPGVPLLSFSLLRRHKNEMYTNKEFAANYNFLYKEYRKDRWVVNLILASFDLFLTCFQQRLVDDGIMGLPPSATSTPPPPTVHVYATYGVPPCRYYWESVVLLQKAAFAVAVVASAVKRDVAVQLLLALFVVEVMLVMQLIFRPFRHTRIDTLNRNMLIVTTATLYLLLYLAYPIVGASNFIVITVIVIAINALLIFYFLVSFACEWLDLGRVGRLGDEVREVGRLGDEAGEGGTALGKRGLRRVLAGCAALLKVLPHCLNWTSLVAAEF